MKYMIICCSNSKMAFDKGTSNNLRATNKEQPAKKQIQSSDWQLPLNCPSCAVYTVIFCSFYVALFKLAPAR